MRDVSSTSWSVDMLEGAPVLKPVPGLAFREPGLTGPKNVEGFISGYAVKEGGGTAVGKM